MITPVNAMNFLLENESLRAIVTLRKPNIAKIQKIQLMKQYFKDYKSKMLKEEQELKKQAQVTFQNESVGDHQKGVFVKRKAESGDGVETSTFLFNFKDPSEREITQINAKLASVELSQ